MFMESRKFLTGRIKWASVDRVISVLRGAYPRVVSTHKVRLSTYLNQRSVPKILDYLQVKGDVVAIETTEGEVFWQWVKRNNSD
jgi:hypothetical protein